MINPCERYDLQQCVHSINKNDNIHKNEVQNIGFGIPIEFLSQKEKNIQIGPETTKLDYCGQDSHFGKEKYRILNPNQNSKSKNFFLLKSVKKQRKNID